MKRAIVLSGGGSKGAYQIGVWKALRKLKIDYNIVTGTSIGSVNGIMMVQKEYHKAAHLWKNIGFDDIFDVQFPTNKNMLEIYKKYASEFLKNGGMETSKIYNFLDTAYNEKKFFKSDIDYGIVTVNASKMKPKIMQKKDLRDNLIKYVLASSTCFPAFQLTNIDECHYIDGGYYDNLPIQTAIDMGADEIIAIDLGAVGLKKKISNTNVKITYITPNNDIGSFLVFDKNLSRKAIKYGYNDTMKVFNRLEGKLFTFENKELFNNYNRKNKIYFEEMSNIIKNHSTSRILSSIMDYSTYSKILNKKDFNFLFKTFNETLEYAAKLLELDETNIYNINYFNFCIKHQIFKYETFSSTYIHKIIKNKVIKKKTNRRAIMLYIYNELNKRKLRNIEFLTLINLYPKEFMAALYIKTI